jgi:catechol 2,3-dioxygenase-like lactoylglutathione lyase family enzyme
VTTPTAQTLEGVHHVRLPVNDLEESAKFWIELLGYERDFDFPGTDGPAGWALKHARGGPNIVLWHDPERAAAASGFPWFSIGMAEAGHVRELAAELDRRGIRHGGIQDAFVEIKLPFVQDPNGHLIGFYVLNTQSAGSKPLPAPKTRHADRDRPPAVI